MGLTPSQKQDLKCELSTKINQSTFEKLIINKEGNGYSCQVEGDLFAIIGAIGHLIYDFHKHTNIPVHVLNTYISLSAEMVEEVSLWEQQQYDCEEDADEEQFTKFMDILTGKRKEDK